MAEKPERPETKIPEWLVDAKERGRAIQEESRQNRRAQEPHRKVQKLIPEHA